MDASIGLVSATAESKSHPRPVGESSGGPGEKGHFHKSVQWSADGSCLLAHDHSDGILTYLIDNPTSLLEKQTLLRHSLIRPSAPVWACVGHPVFEFSKPETALVLVSPRDHPIQLHQTSLLRASAASSLRASYPLVNTTTEQYITPHSLAFGREGTRFISGSKSLICVFDLSRPNGAPLAWLPTIPSVRHLSKGGGVGIKGIVSALAVSVDDTLVAGTFSRWVGLYANGGQGQSIAVWAIGKDEHDVHVGGCGITQTLWSPCGRYLHIAERMSDGIRIYDVRVTGRELGVLTGRNAWANTRIGVDIRPNAYGYDIVGGGTDGQCRVWQNPYRIDGYQDPSASWKAHEGTVSSTVVHPYEPVVATCLGAGERAASATDSNLSIASDALDQGPEDKIVKVWALPNSID